MHCQRYFPTEIIMFAVNWRHVGWPTKYIKFSIYFNKIQCKSLIPERPQSEQEINISGWPDLFDTSSPKQKSQYGDGFADLLPDFVLVYP